METFHRVEQRRAKPVPPTRSDDRLPIGRSAAVITVLCLLCWAAVLAIAAGLRSLM
jgi:hypothetical protein